jgi:hypothetical protein
MKNSFESQSSEKEPQQVFEEYWRKGVTSDESLNELIGLFSKAPENVIDPEYAEKIEALLLKIRELKKALLTTFDTGKLTASRTDYYELLSKQDFEYLFQRLGTLRLKNYLLNTDYPLQAKDRENMEKEDKTFPDWLLNSSEHKIDEMMEWNKRQGEKYDEAMDTLLKDPDIVG